MIGIIFLGNDSSYKFANKSSLILLTFLKKKFKKIDRLFKFSSPSLLFNFIVNLFFSKHFAQISINLYEQNIYK